MKEEPQQFLEFQLTAPLSIDMDELALQVEKDETLQRKIRGVLVGDKEFESYTVEKGSCSKKED